MPRWIREGALQRLGLSASFNAWVCPHHQRLSTNGLSYDACVPRCNRSLLLALTQGVVIGIDLKYCRPLRRIYCEQNNSICLKDGLIESGDRRYMRYEVGHTRVNICKKVQKFC